MRYTSFSVCAAAPLPVIKFLKWDNRILAGQAQLQ